MIANIHDSPSPRPLRPIGGPRWTFLALFLTCWSTTLLFYFTTEKMRVMQLEDGEEQRKTRIGEPAFHDTQIERQPEEAALQQDPPQRNRVNVIATANAVPIIAPSSVHPNTSSRTQETTNACVWNPSSHTACSVLLRQRLQLPLRRLLFFGDSTIHKLFVDGILWIKLVDDAMDHCPQSSCVIRSTERCNLTYGNQRTTPNEWYAKPDLMKGEGPVSVGWNNPGCSDCSNCDSRFVECTGTTQCQVPHGGFVHMEYARDVEWQTMDYTTTQENTAKLLQHNGSEVYDNTVCVMAAGLHDMDVPFTNIERYIQNVEWYLSLYLDTICQQVVWLSNTAPMTNNYTQTIAKTKEWNEAVKSKLRQSFFNSTVYIDLWDASQTERHADNLHMDVAWNKKLTELFLRLWFRDVI